MQFQYTDIVEEKQDQLKRERTPKPKINFLDLAFKYWYIPIALIVILVLGKRVALLGTLAGMVITTLLVATLRYRTEINLGIELITFYSIMLSIAFNPFAGALFATAMILISESINGRICAFLLVKLGIHVGLCFIAPLVLMLGHTWFVCIMASARSIILSNITYFTNKERFFRDIPGATINLFLNAFLFGQITTTALALLTI
jgi:hypothetical protein